MFYHVTNARGVMIEISNIPSNPTLYLFSLVYWSHTEQVYSSDGRTKDLYACSLRQLKKTGENAGAPDNRKDRYHLPYKFSYLCCFQLQHSIPHRA